MRTGKAPSSRSLSYSFSPTLGLDGLAGSVGIVLVAGLAGLSFMARGEEALVVAVVGAAIIGGLIPFLFLNLPPAKLFMGDVGALPIGAAIGLMVWQLGFNQPSEFPTWLALAAMSLVMVAGLLPVPIQIASVKLRHGKRVFRKTPIHHAFQDMGIAETRIVGSYLLSQVLLSAFGISVVLWLNRLTDFHWAMTVK
jgi:phospho-N-acetylmuramoyl-pentapeptide-transferase